MLVKHYTEKEPRSRAEWASAVWVDEGCEHPETGCGCECNHEHPNMTCDHEA